MNNSSPPAGSTPSSCRLLRTTQRSNRMTRPTSLRILGLVLVAACGAADKPLPEPDLTVATKAAAAAEAPARPEFQGIVTSKKSQIITAAFNGRLLRLDVHA